MTVRDAGMLALGFLAGMVLTSASMISMARDQQHTDEFMRALRAKFSDPKVRGQG